MKLYIESIEGGTYLASIGEVEKQDMVRDRNNEPMTFHCLNEIKVHLNQKYFDEVWLKQSTPYDEMCGLDDKHEKLEMLIDWNQK
ncbi:MAG: hypothetical protein ACI936_001162 [Paraglaciecola sp.]|jgi:hypothetical protein